MDIAYSINEIETQVGRLSPMQKFLLGTDGSVTQILEAITGKPVVIETRVQKIVKADPATAEVSRDQDRENLLIIVSLRSRLLQAVKC